MNLSKNILLLSSAFILYSSCVSEFDPPSQGYENLLVVEAFLSDGEDPFVVKLSRSVPIDTSAFVPESGAFIQLTEESGESYNISETLKPGVYNYFPINAQVGKTYQLHIETRDGNRYESSPVTMRATPEIDSVNFKYEERPTAGLKGVQIYVNTHDPQSNTWYYRWEWEETWVFYTPYASTHIYENGQVLLREENINQCWKNSSSTAIDIATSKNLTEDFISEYPLLYVSTNTDRLGNKYSLNVKQYALSEESYNYWTELQKATESLGTLFDPQPTTVMGNIHNIDNDSEVVLGYFDASSVSEKRIFINRGDLPAFRVHDYYLYCEDSTVSFNGIEELMKFGYMLAYETQNEFGAFVYVMSYPTCIDCRFAGSNVRPDFWP